MSKTTDAIYDEYVSKQKDWRRGHLGASQIGAPCDRALWFQFHWCCAPKFEGKTLRLFETGNLEEERIVNDLRSIGVEIYDRDPKNPESQIHYVDPDCGGHFSGSLDGVAKGFPEPGFEDEWMVCEFKTANQKRSDTLQRKGVEEANPQHYCQMQIYLNWSGLKHAMYISKNKNTEELYREIVPYNEVIAHRCRERAKKIIFADEPPARCNGAKPDGWNCKYCQFADLCFGKVLPEVNCRTCAHSEPFKAGGQWSCLRHSHFIDADTMREGCPDHIYLPSLVPVDVADADPERGTITYADGVCNGPGCVSSREMRKKYEH